MTALAENRQNTKKHIIPIFIPHYGCRHQCIFCNQKTITAQTAPVTPKKVHEIINQALMTNTNRQHIEVAFYGGSFTALDIDVQNSLLEPAADALREGKIQSIRLSTRPDAIDGNILKNLVKFKVGTIELGVQSLDGEILQNAARGHTVQDVLRSVSLIRTAGMTCGLQLMPGLPGEGWLSLIATARRAISLKPDFARIYPAVVIAGTVMAGWYEQGLYRPLSLAEAVSRAAYLKLVFKRANIPVIRTGLQATAELDRGDAVIAGPYHPAFGEMTESYLFYLMLAHFIEQAAHEDVPEVMTVCHHFRDSSKVRGIGLENIKKLKKNYGLRQICLQADGIKCGELIIEHNYKKYHVTSDIINLI